MVFRSDWIVLKTGPDYKCLSSWTRNNNRVVRTQIRTYSYNEKGLYLDNNIIFRYVGDNAAEF